MFKNVDFQRVDSQYANSRLTFGILDLEKGYLRLWISKAPKYLAPTRTLVALPKKHNKSPFEQLLEPAKICHDK